MHHNVAVDNKDFFLNCDLTEINCLDSIAIRIADINRKIRSTSDNPHLKKIRQRLYERRYYLKKVRPSLELQKQDFKILQDPRQDSEDVKVLGERLTSSITTGKQDLVSSPRQDLQDKILQENIDLNQDLEGGKTFIPEVQGEILQDVKVLGESLASRTITDKQDFVCDKIDSKQDLEQDKIKNPVSSCGEILQDPRQSPNLDKDLSKTRSSRQDLSEARSCKTPGQMMSQDFVASWKQDLARYLGFLFRCIFLLSCTVALGWFVMLQTLPLYKSLSFDLPDRSEASCRERV